MSSLTNTAYYTRLSIKWGIVGIIILFLLKSLLTSALDVWKAAHPPPPPPPDVAFGKLPTLKFPKSTVKASELKFKLETIDGRAYVASNSAAVYFIPKPAPNLLSLTRAQQFATKLNLDPQAVTNDKIFYRFRDLQFPTRTMDFDIITNNFELNYDYTSDLSLFAQKNPPSAAEVIMQAKNFLQNFSLYSDSLANGKEKITFLALSGNNLIPTTSLASSDAVRVDFGRADIEGLKLFTPDPSFELVYFIFSGSNVTEKKILKASYKFWPIEIEQRATYPLRSAQNAWEELQKGEGFIARLQSSATDDDGQANVVIRNIYLGFYYPDNYQQFLQPIYVFEGDPNFLGYVSAIDSAWVEQEPAN